MTAKLLAGLGPKSDRPAALSAVPLTRPCCAVCGVCGQGSEARMLQTVNLTLQIVRSRQRLGAEQV